MRRELEILFEDNHLIAVNKPSGLLVQGDETGDETLSDLTKEYIKHKYQKPGAVFLGVIHRIDRPVSGAVLMARTSKGLSRMNEAFRNRSVQKIYLAGVEGVPRKKEDTLVHWLTKNESLNRVTVFPRETDGASRCELDYKVIGVFGKQALLEVHPLTGRSHQIRAQLAAMGHPIAGDVKYGSSVSSEEKSIALHSAKLIFEHPVSRETITLSAPLPDTLIWQPYTS